MRLRCALGLLAAATVLPGCPGTDPDVLPLAPDGVTAVALTTTTAQVTWNDRSDNEASFVLQSSPDGSTWKESGTAPVNATSGIAKGLAPGVPTFLRVGSVNVKGMAPSPPSMTVSTLLPAWSPLAAGPAALFWSSSAYDHARRRMYVFGGTDPALLHHNEIWALELDATPPTWFPVLPAPGNVPPVPRINPSVIFDPLGDRLILFGGYFPSSSPLLQDELWEFRISTSQWLPLPAAGTPPGPNAQQAAVYDAGRGRMVLWSGFDYSPDVHALLLPAGGVPTWSKFPLSGPAPTPRVATSAVYDPATRRMIVFAGLDNNFIPDNSYLAGDTWALDLSTDLPTAWTPLTTSGTPPTFRASHMAVLDTVNHQMVVIGGWDNDDGIPVDETWTLTLSGVPTWRQWTPLAPTPGPRQEGSVIFDPVKSRMILFGGGLDEFLTPTDQTWSLGL